MAADVPWWASETTPEHSYKLVLFESDDEPIEDIDLSRAEFIALKRHLAAMRGYNVPSVADALETIRNDESLAMYVCEDDQQVARHLETARDLFRRVPHLVMVQSEHFDKEVSRITA